jgi:hypothetical protein
VTILHDENGGLDEEQEPITIYQPEEEDQATDRDFYHKKNIPRESLKVHEQVKKEVFSPTLNDTII